MSATLQSQEPQDLITTRALRAQPERRAQRYAQRKSNVILARILRNSGPSYENSIRDALESYDPQVRAWGVQEMGRIVRHCTGKPEIEALILNLVGAPPEEAQLAVGLHLEVKNMDPAQRFAVMLEAGNAYLAPQGKRLVIVEDVSGAPQGPSSGGAAQGAPEENGGA